MNSPADFAPACPVPLSRYARIVMAHGGGGRLMQQLIRDLFIAAFGPTDRHDSVVLAPPPPGWKLAFTTDAFVVRPLFFPGGDLGDLAVNGTVNDLAMSGSRPRWLSAAFILEEGLEIDCLWRIACSMQRAAARAGVTIVTGDTKVVERGHGDGVFVATSGIGEVEETLAIAPPSVRPGDAVIVSGDLGRHGLAILAAREELGFRTSLLSDTAPLAAPVRALVEAGVDLHCLRDLTRGGLAATFNEIAAASGTAISLEEARIPLAAEVKAACELLGFEPLQLANEGRMAVFLPRAEVERALAILRRDPVTAGSACVGEVIDGPQGRVTVRSVTGGRRILDLPSGELLPRIC